MSKPLAAISWSGGKDSCAALARVRSSLDVVAMATMFDEDAARSRSHGLRPEVLLAQADRLGLRHVVGRCTWQTYDHVFSDVLASLAAGGITHVVFGDILFEEHRRWAECMCEPHGLTAVEPLFGSSTETLFDEWVASGADAIIVTARTQFFDQSWPGRRLGRELLPELKRLGVDPCGERGEYHTVVTNAPLFTSPLTLRLGELVERSDCWALDVTVDLDGREGPEGRERQEGQTGSARGHANPRTKKSEGEHRRQFALGRGPRRGSRVGVQAVGPQRQCRKEGTPAATLSRGHGDPRRSVSARSPRVCVPNAADAVEWRRRGPAAREKKRRNALRP
jgi:uncharacterized protein (TIGR00290 family)